jgi:hypothetical protein
MHTESANHRLGLTISVEPPLEVPWFEDFLIQYSISIQHVKNFGVEVPQLNISPV